MTATRLPVYLEGESIQVDADLVAAVAKIARALYGLTMADVHKATAARWALERAAAFARQARGEATRMKPGGRP